MFVATAAGEIVKPDPVFITIRFPKNALAIAIGMRKSLDKSGKTSMSLGVEAKRYDSPKATEHCDNEAPDNVTNGTDGHDHAASISTNGVETPTSRSCKSKKDTCSPANTKPVATGLGIVVASEKHGTPVDRTLNAHIICESGTPSVKMAKSGEKAPTSCVENGLFVSI